MTWKPISTANRFRSASTTRRSSANLSGSAAVEWELTSRSVLPIRMKGLFTYSEAYKLACDWNCWHVGEDMAFPAKRETGT